MGSRRFRGFARVAVILIVFAAVVCPLTIFGQQAGQPQDKDKDKDKKELPPPEQKVLPPTVSEEPTLVAPTLGGAGKPLPGPAPGGSGSVSEIAVDKARDSGTVDQALRDSSSATGVGTQRRSAVSFDPRVRGYHVGQLTTIADGAYWTPARIDLDTALGKINPDWVQNIEVIKGPYSVRHGPGFAFLDVETAPPERYKGGEFEAHGSSSLGYRTNGQGWTARQYLWGGNCDWGFRLGYNITAGNDYYMGNGERLPTSYNSHNVDFAFGVDLSKHSSLEVKYLRVQQYDVEYPGLLTDINNLATDGVSVRYAVKESPWFDQLTVDSWYNFTSFNGDSSRPSKRFQIPQLDAIAQPGVLPGGTQIRLDLETQADLYSWGVREAMTWGQKGGVELTLGADINIVRQQYDEFDSFNFSVTPPPVPVPGSPNFPSNFGIPKSRSTDPGIFVDGALPLGEALKLHAGGRVDFVSTELLRLGFNQDFSDYRSLVGADAFNTQHFLLTSGFLTAECKATDHLTYFVGYGYAERPPLLTELYSGGAFFGLIQNGLNSIYGDPTLSEERMHQFDVSVTAKYDRFRAGASGFFSWIQDYITYENFFTSGAVPTPPPNGNNFFTITDIEFNGRTFNAATLLRQYRFINTGMARFYGFESYGEFDVLPWLAPYATVSYVDGYDLSRNEPLPGIVPIEARVGLRFHDPNKDKPRWGLEFQSRLVGRQTRTAESLGERDTPGFVVFDARSFWQPGERLLVTAGVENIGDRFYQEHLDLRTGRGVYQPGVNMYVSMRVNY